MPAGTSPQNRSRSSRTVLHLRPPGPIDSSVAHALGAEFVVESRIAGATGVFESFDPAAFDIVLLDLRRADADALGLLAAARAWNREAALVVAAPDLPDDVVLEALRLDVGGLVIEPADSHSVAECVRLVADGHLCLDQRILRRAVKTLAERQIAAREMARVLTAREVEIVQLAGRGLTNKEIAAALFLAEGTIKVHLHNVFEKLGVKSRKALASLAKEKGLA